MCAFGLHVLPEKSVFAFEKVEPTATISWNGFAETICYSDIQT